MRIILLTLLIVIFCFYADAQVIPQERTVDWSDVNNIEITQPTIQVNVKDFGAIGDGINDDTQAILNAIEFLDGGHGYVFFPTGNYLIKNTIILPDSCILKGDGSERSLLLFDLEGSATNCINISKSQSANFTPISSGLNKGNNLITVEDPDIFEPGDYVEIRQENGSWDVVPISWADYSVGQITRIASVVGNKLLLESGLRIDYSPALNPEVRPVIPIEQSGVQCLKIKRLDEPLDGSGANIYMYMAANCFVRGVESDTSVGAHVSIVTSLNVLIEGNYFHHAFKYDGAGMRGYGVALSMHTSECLITNNIFRHLRHAMMIKTGANGNVFSYNYSIEPHRSEPIPDASGDISFHGHYPFSNLWEGNIAQNIVIDHYWGPSGPYNTLFRNRAELWGIIMTDSDLQETNMQNFVGNEVTSTLLLHGLYNLTGTDQFEYSNNVQGNFIPAGTVTLQDDSYYLEEKPWFWNDLMEWPSVGTPVEPGTGKIPAVLRYESENYTICPDSIVTRTFEYDEPFSDVRIWPVPASNKFNIYFGAGNGKTTISLINTLGEQIMIKEFPFIRNQTITISTSDLPAGINFVTLVRNNEITTKKIIVTR